MDKYYWVATVRTHDTIGGKHGRTGWRAAAAAPCCRRWLLPPLVSAAAPHGLLQQPSLTKYRGIIVGARAAGCTPTRQGCCRRPPRKPPPRTAGGQRTWPCGLQGGRVHRGGGPLQGHTRELDIFSSFRFSVKYGVANEAKTIRAWRPQRSDRGFPLLRQPDQEAVFQTIENPSHAQVCIKGRIDSPHCSPPCGAQAEENACWMGQPAPIFGPQRIHGNLIRRESCGGARDHPCTGIRPAAARPARLCQSAQGVQARACAGGAGSVGPSGAGLAPSH